MRVLSGIQPSGNGELHIGNYLGAVKQWIELQDVHESYFMLANLHAITVSFEPKQIRENVYKTTALYLALGLDPHKSTIFVQSLVPEHAELAWLLNTMATMGEMRRMTQFKDKAKALGENPEGIDGPNHNLQTVMATQQLGENVSVGLFDYPVLMAADILLYQAQLVPVGDDQKQHIELTRNLAERFNKKFGQVFVVPDPLIPDRTARIMGLDNPHKKMSKSLGPNNFISLLDDAPTIREKMKKAVTDSGNEVHYNPEDKPAVSNLLTIYAAVTGRKMEDLEQEFVVASYGQLKEDLAEALIEFLAPVQERYQAVIANQDRLDQLLREGSAKAQQVARTTLNQAKERMGIL